MYQHLEIALGDSDLSMSCIRNNSCKMSDIRTFNSGDSDSKMMDIYQCSTDKTKKSTNL